MSPHGITGPPRTKVHGIRGVSVGRCPKVLEVQGRALGPLSPCRVWWGSDFTRRGGGQNVEFCLFVCLFVRHAFECQSLCDQFSHEGVRVQKRF